MARNTFKGANSPTTARRLRRGTSERRGGAARGADAAAGAHADGTWEWLGAAHGAGDGAPAFPTEEPDCSDHLSPTRLVGS